MEETISLKELFLVIKKRINLVIIITLLAVMASAIISYFILTPVYQARAQLLVNQAKSEEAAFNYNEVQTNLQLINTYNGIIKSPAILEIVIADLDLKESVGQLTEKITVQNDQNSQIVNLDVKDEDPLKAEEIANKTADVFQKEIVDIMSVDNVNILAKADVGENPSPVEPNPLLNIAIAFVVGLMASVGLAFLLEYLDNTIKTEQDIEKLLELPVLGVITTIDASEIQPRKERNARTKGGK